MTSERIKEIQKQTAYPESVSVMLALQKVWNECEQEYLQYGNTTLTRQPMNPIKKWLRKREIRKLVKYAYRLKPNLIRFIDIPAFERELNELD